MTSRILFFVTLLFPTIIFADVDCSSPTYSYNPNVKQLCENLKNSVNAARQNYKDSFSNALIQNQKLFTTPQGGAAKQVAPPTTEQPAASTPAPAQTQTTPAPTTTQPNTPTKTSPYY